MSLANVATYFAQAGHKVLMIDWDMEAPGLHQYFLDYCDDDYFAEKEGLIDFMYYIRTIHEEEFRKMPQEKQLASVVKEAPLNYGTVENEHLFLKAHFENSFSNYVIPIRDIDNLSIVKAGKKFDLNYSEKAQAFDWQAFFEHSPRFFEYFAQFLQTQYDYVFIDSRTGFTDTSGICTTLLPNILVLAFTPNRQSLDGVLLRAKAATEYRMDYDGEFRPLYIYPLPSRVEADEDALRKEWKKRYENAFSELFKELYELSEEEIAESTLSTYFNKVQLRHTSKYAYGERISIIEDSTEDSLSMANHYANFCGLLEMGQPIWSMKNLKSVF